MSANRTNTTGHPDCYNKTPSSCLENAKYKANGLLLTKYVVTQT